MVFHNFTELRASLGRQEKRTAAVVCAHDETTLKALEQCKDQVSAVLIGDEKKIRGLTDLPYEIIPEEDMLTAARKGVGLVREGKADFLLKGKLDTSLILKAVVDKEHGLRTGRLMSHLAFLEAAGLSQAGGAHRQRHGDPSGSGAEKGNFAKRGGHPSQDGV